MGIEEMEYLLEILGKFMPLEMVMQVSHNLDTEMSPEIALWPHSATPW
jgi:hypothetical protein